MTNAEKAQSRQKSSDEVIAKIKTSRDEARIKANAYKDLTGKKYDYWRAVEAVYGYDDALTMFARATEHHIPNMATIAIANFERARNGDTTEMTLALAEGRKDALVSVADWMNNKEGWDS